MTLEYCIYPTHKKLCKLYSKQSLICKVFFILVRGVAPVMLVAHLDTVHEQKVRDIYSLPTGIF